MQIKTTMKYQFTSIRMAVLKKQKITNVEDVEKLEFVMHCWWGHLMVELPLKREWQFLKKLNIEPPFDLSKSTSEYILKRTEIRDSTRCLSTHVHSSIIHNEKMETPPYPWTKKWTNKDLQRM